MDEQERLKRYRELNRELAEAGVPGEYQKGPYIKIEGPINILVNGPFSAKPYVDIIIKHAMGMDPGGKAFCARAITEKGMKQAVPFLLSIFEEYKDKEIPRGADLWAVGSALYEINDKNSYIEILKICNNPNYGSSRQMLMGSLARMKTGAAYDCLVNCLSDETVRAHAIEGLGRFGDTKAIEILERTEVKKGLYEYKAKNTALRRLQRKLESKK